MEKSRWGREEGDVGQAGISIPADTVGRDERWKKVKQKVKIQQPHDNKEKKFLKKKKKKEVWQLSKRRIGSQFLLN